ncbi:phenylalanyl-tRNA synthetase mitochondrial precursor [Lineolata rhizophorae]|uniref:Phenylalanine--tRNA ligase, mitochondrial n=1 Tax=Lineolata rhizophorae TaxID=578093 RepID=A0A6A6P9G4_9PEZI|nr:phenylalanyl-tRNA synthetase mitochondrial precursor [Lineolata rhizophorae]
MPTVIVPNDSAVDTGTAVHSSPFGLEAPCRRLNAARPSPCVANTKAQSTVAVCSPTASTHPAMPLCSVSGRIVVGGREYPVDEWMNASEPILSAVTRKLHLQSHHPISITRQLIESRFPTYRCHNDLWPIVSVAQNFDTLGFAPDHPGRSRTDTYYINKSTVLRTHTSAHQADLFRDNLSDGFLISADVYRRDAVDRNHYPVFHQMEGAMTWDKTKHGYGDSLARAIWDDVSRIPVHNVVVEDPNPTVHPERNPLQSEHHSLEEVEAVAAHLKRSLEDVVVEVFKSARSAAGCTNDEEEANEPFRIRWVEAYFPFTSPSWELEVFWQGDWLEILGCGVVKQSILNNANVSSRLGWAFGLGLERIAMLLFSIPDIRLFWSQDRRFLDQFESTHPACYKDVAFWLRSTSSSAGGGSRSNPADFHENDMMELVRDVAGDLVEDVRLVDEFVHPTTGRKSLCYRINYRSLERTLTNDEANQLHSRIRNGLAEKLGVELR